MMAGQPGGVALADDGPRLLWGNQGSFDGQILDNRQDQDAQPDQKDAARLSAFDSLRGNGSPAGYMLTHGNVVSDSVIASINGRRLTRNRDYFVDPVSGSISFNQTISPSETIQVTYRYIAGKSVSRSLAGLPLLPNFLGGASTANFLHAYQAADAKNGIPFDVLTYGMKMDFDFGRTNLQSMYYLSDPRKGQTATGLFDKPAASSNAAAVSDTIVAQTASVDLGHTRLSLGYQDVGANFTGFQSLREQGGLDPDVVNQLQKEKGVRRISAAMEMEPSKALPQGTPWNRLGWMQVYDSSGSMRSFELNYVAPSFGAYAMLRSVDSDFKRMPSLSAPELTQLALSTRRQFDPNATAGQVTAADQAAVGQEAGLSRKVLSSYIKLNPKLTGSLSLLNIDDGNGSINKQIFSLKSNSWQSWVSFQSIGPKFARLGQLAPVEKEQFGNQYGLRQTSAGLSAKIGAGLSLNSDYSLVDGETGGVTRASLGLAGRHLNFISHYQNIDPTFTRIGDLADADKKAMASAIGFRRYDMSLDGELSKALKLNTSLVRSNNASEMLSDSQDTLNLLWNPTDRTKLVFQHNLSARRSEGEILSGSLKELQSVEQRFKNNWYISASRSSDLTQAAGGILAGTVVNQEHFETDKARPQWISADNRRLNYMNGKFENSELYQLQSKLGKAVTLQAAQSSVDRGTDPSESMTKVGMKWAASKNINAGLDLLSRQTNYIGNGTGYLANVGGQVAESFGPLKQINLTAELGQTNMSGGESTFTRGIKIDGLWGKNVVGLEYAHLMPANRKSQLARGYTFKSDPDPKKWWHLDLYYKDKDGGWGSLEPIRNINADVRLSPTTQLSYNINQYKELPSGQIDFGVSRSLKLTSKMASGLNLVVDLRHDLNPKAKTDVRKQMVGLQRQSGSFLFDIYYGLDETLTPSGAVTGNSIKLKVDHKIDADRYLTFTGEAIQWNNSNPAIEDRTSVEARLDFRTLFSM